MKSNGPHASRRISPAAIFFRLSVLNWTHLPANLKTVMQVRLFSFFLCVICAAGLKQSAAQEVSVSADPDRVEVQGGVVLTGRIDRAENGFLILSTSYAGIVQVDLARISRILSDRALPEGLPDNLVPTATAAPVASAAAAAAPAPIAPPAPKVAPKPAAGGNDPLGWTLETAFNLTGNQGNTQKFDFSGNITAILRREFDRIRLYGQYAYGTNRGRLSSDEIILGARYTNFFQERFGYFIREEIERDAREGIALRSTTAAGLTLEISKLKNLEVEGRAGFSYRYEDFDKDGWSDYPGMDLGLDMSWKPFKWLRLSGSYTFLPSARDLEDFLFDQDTGVDLPLDQSRVWRLRFGLASKYNSRPDFGRDKLDHRYYARLVGTWK